MSTEEAIARLRNRSADKQTGTSEVHSGERSDISADESAGALFNVTLNATPAAHAASSRTTGLAHFTNISRAGVDALIHGRFRDLETVAQDRISLKNWWSHRRDFSEINKWG